MIHEDQMDVRDVADTTATSEPMLLDGSDEAKQAKRQNESESPHSKLSSEICCCCCGCLFVCFLPLTPLFVAQ
jgi:hypothetical protein